MCVCVGGGGTYPPSQASAEGLGMHPHQVGGLLHKIFQEGIISPSFQRGNGAVCLQHCAGESGLDGKVFEGPQASAFSFKVDTMLNVPAWNSTV